eukprot:1269536-Amphidinium_carterae.1
MSWRIIAQLPKTKFLHRSQGAKINQELVGFELHPPSLVSAGGEKSEKEPPRLSCACFVKR